MRANSVNDGTEVPTAPERDAAARRSTISDVARAAGVSRTTVSYVLSERPDVRVPEATRRRIVDAARRIGYRRNALAAGFRSGRMNTVGILFSGSMVAFDPADRDVYYKDLVLAIATAGFAAGLNPLLMSEDASREITLSDLTDRRADGVIIAVREHAQEFVRTAEAAGMPCVTVGQDCGAWQVHTDNALGGRIAVEYLLSLGHRRIAHYWHGREYIYSAQHRRDSFRDVVREAGIAPPDAREFTGKDAAPLADALCAPHGPTAVFCYNDEMAVWLLDECHARGIRVPEDLSIIGFDDNVLAVMTRPRLTTVHNPLTEIARAAIDLLQRQLRGEAPPPGPVFIAPSLVTRESTAPPSPRAHR